MQVECSAIILIILLCAFFTAQTGRKRMAVAILPLILVPAVHLITLPAAPKLAAALNLESVFLAVCMETVGLVVACILLGLNAAALPSKAAARTYMVMCGGFSLVLSLVFIHSLLA